MEINDAGLQLVRVLSYYGLMTDAVDSSFKIICPLHEDVNPSMMINLEVGSFYCYGCGKFGKAFDLVKGISGLNDLQACKQFNHIMKMDEINILNLSKRLKHNKLTTRQAYNEAFDYYYGLRTVDWCLDNTNIQLIKKYLLKRGLEPRVLNYAGAKYTYTKNYPVIFPMLDNGQFKGWVCRTTDRHIEKKRKYLYNKGFSRSTTLAGEYSKRSEVFIVEGYIDRLKLAQYKQYNSVAILGWKITGEQVNKLKKKGVKTVVSCLDNDDPGRRGTKELKKHFEVIEWQYESGIKDPGEMSEEQFDRMMYKTLK